MSTQLVETIRRPAQPAYPEAVPPTAPPLNAGDRLSRAEFERRYEAHPEIKKAELIEGVVYMPRPTRFARHSEPHGWIITWLGVYCAATPGIRLGDNATVRLDFENEVQPDALLRLETAQGGRSRVTTDDYLEGPPELIVEIAASSAAYDLHDKRRVYQRSGVQEYLAVHTNRYRWMRLAFYAARCSPVSGYNRRLSGLGTWQQCWPRCRKAWFRRNTPRLSHGCRARRNRSERTERWAWRYPAGAYMQNKEGMAESHPLLASGLAS